MINHKSLRFQINLYRYSIYYKPVINCKLNSMHIAGLHDILESTIFTTFLPISFYFWKREGWNRYEQKAFGHAWNIAIPRRAFRYFPGSVWNAEKSRGSVGDRINGMFDIFTMHLRALHVSPSLRRNNIGLVWLLMPADTAGNWTSSEFFEHGCPSTGKFNTFPR